MKKQTPIHFGLLWAGFVLLANPVPMLFDLLPDALGYLFLYIALRGISHNLSYFSECRRAFRNLAWLTLSKHIVFFLTLKIAAASSFREGAILSVGAIAYGIAELCLLLPAVRSLFAGIYHLGERWDCTAAILPFGKRGQRPEGVEWLTLIFFCFRVGMSTIPECILAFVTDEDKVGRHVLIAYGIVALVAFLLVTIFAVVFLKQLKAYLSVVKTAAEGSSTYLELGHCTPLTAAKLQLRHLSLGLLLVVIGTLFTLDISIDHISILPDYLAGVAFLGGILFLGLALGDGRKGVILAVGYIATALLHEILLGSYYDAFLTPETATYHPEAKTLYLFVILSAILAEGFLIPCLVRVRRCFIRINDTLVCTKDTTGDTLLQKQTRREVRVLSLLHLVLGIVTAVASALKPLSYLSYVKAETVEGFVSEPRLAWYPHAVVLLGVAYLCLTLYLAHRLRAESYISLDEDIQ